MTISKQYLMHLAIAFNNQIQLTGKGINHRYTHPMQTTRELVVIIGELATGM